MSDISCQNLKPPSRILLGPGPSNVPPSVQRAMLEPIVGYMDPYAFTIMDDIVNLQRFLFQTQNELTLPISGTGSAGMDAAFCNFLESGDVVVIGVNGFFGERMVDFAQRYGATVVRVDTEWGRIVEPEAIEAVLKAQKNVKLLALVHAETSTGVLQPLAEASQIAKEYDALFLVDAVTSLGGQEVAVDAWGIDICYSGSQKCIGGPSGLSPFTANQAAQTVLKARTTKVPSFYLDISLLSAYWFDKIYHHTGPICLFYALHEALALIAEEGLESRCQRHLRNGTALQAGLQAMRLALHAQDGHRLSVLTSVRIPSGVDDLRVRKGLLNEFGIEVGGGLGALKGKIWRIGLMGHSSSAENVLLLLHALEKQLDAEGYSVEPGAGMVAANQVLGKK
ncbi:pyridoxal-phosphate-dependent aminotransferase family protein [Chloroflexota bacterium]